MKDIKTELEGGKVLNARHITSKTNGERAQILSVIPNPDTVRELIPTALKV